MNRARLTACLGLLLVHSACSSTPALTQILLVVDTELPVPGSLDGMVVEVVAPDGTASKFTESFGQQADDKLPASLAIVHEAGALAPLEVEVTGTLDGQPLLSRRARTSFVRGETRVLRLELTVDCLGRDCMSDDRTCVDAECRGIDIPQGELPPWDGSPPRRGEHDSLDAGTGIAEDAGHDAGQGGSTADAAPDACDPSPEVCNGTDDDCDGRVDEGPGDPADTSRVCDAGAEPCVDADRDGVCDVQDTCIDADGDGLGVGATQGCVLAEMDTNDELADQCGDWDGDGCDDCASGAYDPSADGTDLDGDGFCNVGDCSDGSPFCDTDCTDRDGDGYCANHDCDDGVPDCTTDCATNSDSSEAAPLSDCIERYCGSSPTDPLSTCVVVATPTALIAALEGSADGTGSRSILVTGPVTLSDAPPKLSARGTTLRAVAGATITYTGGGNQLLEVTGHDVVLEGLSLESSTVKAMILVSGDGARLLRNRLGFTLEAGIRLIGTTDALVRDNLIFGVQGEEGDTRGGIVVRDATRTTVVGNIVADNGVDGLQVRGAAGLLADHNTLAANSDGIQISDASTDLCFRNNILTGNTVSALRVSDDSAFDVSATCTAPLDGDMGHGNNAFGHALRCSDADCTDCACLPGTFFSFSVDPELAGGDPGTPGSYCLGAAALVDGATDLGHDRNGPTAGNFFGPAPDVGGSERGVGPCL